MNSLTLNLINMFSTLFPISCLNDCLPEEFLWDQIHGPMLARIWTSDCIRGFPYEPSILSLVYVSKKCSIIGVNLRLFMRPTLCILCELTSECLYSASAEWCPAAVAVYYVLMKCLCHWSFNWKEPSFHAPAPLLHVNHSMGKGDEWGDCLKKHVPNPN